MKHLFTGLIIAALASTTMMHRIAHAAGPISLICRGPVRFAGPFTVGNTQAYFYATDNSCSSGTYFQVQLYVPQAAPWTACDQTFSSSYCNSGNGTCNPCYSPGQIDQVGSMYAYVKVNGVPYQTGPF